MIPREELLRIKRIASRVNPRIKDWAGLSDRKERERLGLTLAEGAKLVGEALEAPSGGILHPSVLLVSDSGAQKSGAHTLFLRAAELGMERISLADDCFAKISGLKNSDGIAALLSISPPGDGLESLWIRRDARWLVAAGVQDPGNAGALARTALAAGCSGCLFLDGADPYSPKFLRGSMGAVFKLPCLSDSVASFATSWEKTGARLVVADAGVGARDYRKIDYHPPLALLVGGERGMPEPLAVLANARAHIPLKGDVESLNLAVAAGVILFQAERHWNV